MGYLKRIVLCIVGIVIFVLGAIFPTILDAQSTGAIIITIFCALAAAVDAFVFMLPYMMKLLSVKYAKIDFYKYSYDKKTFVDRKEIFREITEQMNALMREKERIKWIRLHGTDGIGKKCLISKLFKKYSYPLNRWYFLQIDNCSIEESLLKQYPSNEKISIDSYLKILSKTRRTIIVITFKSLDNIMVNKIISFLSNWNQRAKNKLLIFSLDNDNNSSLSNKKIVGNEYICEYFLTPLKNEDSDILVNKLLKTADAKIKDSIISLSKGTPSLIKLLCEFVNENIDNEKNDLSNWQINLTDSQLISFCKIFIIYVAKDKITENELQSIVNNDNLEIFKSRKLLICINEYYIVSNEIYNKIILTKRYEDILRKAINFLKENNVLSDEHIEKVNAIIFYDVKRTYEYLKKLDEQYNYVEIKSIFSRINNDYKFENEEKKIILIFLNCFLKLGEYDLFDSFIKRNSIKAYIPTKQNSTIKMNEDDFLYNYYLADYYHLTSDYDTSNYIFEILLNTQISEEQELLIQFNIAHNYRHAGNFDLAKEKFNICLDLCNENKKLDETIKIRALTGIISIEYVENYSINVEERLNQLTPYISINNNVKYNVIRHVAKIHMLNEEIPDTVEKILNENINELENNNLRIVQDYYFELAEYYRLKYNTNSSYYNLSLSYYTKAIVFAEINNDINLKLCANIGKYLLFYAKDKNTKKLRKNMENIIVLANTISQLILACIKTILALLNKDSDYIQVLKNKNLIYYAKLLEENINDMKQGIISIRVFVM